MKTYVLYAFEWQKSSKKTMNKNLFERKTVAKK